MVHCRPECREKASCSYPSPVLTSSGGVDKKIPRRPAKATIRRLKALGEAIILQAMEDLGSRVHRRKSIEFFSGQGFEECADLAGLKETDRMKLISMLAKSSGMGKL
jgi:hypothetical protein